VKYRPSGNPIADEFGVFGAVFGTALKESNQAPGYNKHGGISAICEKTY